MAEEPASKAGLKHPADYNTLITNGTFQPSLILTPQVKKYQEFKQGWLLDLTLSTFHGHWADQRTKTPPDPSIFNVAHVNVTKWADTAVAHGVDYAALTLLTEYGFLLYPSEVQYNMSQVQIGATLSPYYTKPYCVQSGCDQHIVQKFITEFKKRNIEPVCYFGFGGNMNLANTASGQMFEGSVPADRQELIVQYNCKVMQEILRKFDFTYVWVDMAATIPQPYIQRLYNAAKSINPKAVIIGNVLGETNFSRFPYDVASVEEYIAYKDPGYVSQNTMTYGGITYSIPREIVGTPYSAYSQWYYYDALCPVQPVNNPFTGRPPYLKMQPDTIATFQGLANVSKGAHRPFLAAMLVDRNGNLVQETLDYYRQIQF